MDAVIGVSIGVGDSRHRFVLQRRQSDAGVAFSHRSVLLGADVIIGASCLNPPFLR